jgi:hypothetical protein
VVESYVSAIFAATVRLGTMILGPGAFSVDPRIYGRREIIIPPRSPQPRSFLRASSYLYLNQGM